MTATGAGWKSALPMGPASAPAFPVASGYGDEGTSTPATPEVWAHDGQGFWFRHPGADGITTFAYRVERPEEAAPAWAHDAVIYHIFLDRFHPGTPDGRFAPGPGPSERHGGTLRGVRAALPYLQELGVTLLWLSPLHEAETYHRYDATDLYRVDPALGMEADLRELVDDLHARGMRVLLDFVPSHSSWHHPAFEAARRDPDAPTARWYTFIRRPDAYRSFMGTVRTLPSFNLEDPGAREHVIGAAVHWLRAYGVDGFRLDHAIGPGMDFWVAFRTATRAAAPDTFTTGEATDTPDALRRYRGRLDSVLDFPLAQALRWAFGTGEWDVATLDTFLTAYDAYMAGGPARVSFLDNHDMNRFLHIAGNGPDAVGRLKLAALCQFTLAPTPAIYYGTEVGLSHEGDIAERARGGDAQARGDMPWDEAAWDHDLLEFYRALIRLRRGRPALRGGARRTVHLDGAAGTYGYIRTVVGHPGEDALVVFNLGTRERTIGLPSGATYRTLLTTGQPPSYDEGALTIPARTGAIMEGS